MQNDNVAGIRGHYHESSDCFEYPKKSLLKSSHRKKYLPNFPTQKIPGIEISNPEKSFDHPCHLKSGVPPTPPPPPLGIHTHMYNAKTPNHHAHVQYIANVTNTKHFLESPNNYNLQVVIFLLQLYMYMYIFHEFKIQLKVDK